MRIPVRQGSGLALLLVAVACAVPAPRSAVPADLVYARPGQLVDAGGFRLNLYCMGSGSPAVVFDSGWGDWAPAWSKVQPEIAKWTRACSYDRAGTGFSDPGPMPRTSVRIAGELRTALHQAGVGAPYILVGSAFGGDNVRTFADLYLEEVAGMVLVDADPTDVAPASLREDEHRAHAGIPSDLRDCRDAITGHKPLDCARNFFFRGLPEAAWSPELNAKVLEVAETKVAMYDAFSSEMQETASDETWLQQHRRSLGSRPLRVLTSGNHAVGHLETKPPDTPKHLEYEREMTLAQARWLELSSNARQVFPRNSSEYIQFDAPQTLIDAVREVYDQATGAPPAGAPSAPAPGTAFRDCPECPEMVVVPAGSFTMGSSAAEKSWAASHGGSAGSVADEAPQHRVSLRAFALGKYVVTRGEYAAFVHETGRSSADACRVSSMPKAAARAGANWENPGFGQTDRDPAVCVSWHDARAYAEWLNDKVRPRLGLTGRGPYRLPSEAEWEYAARAGTATRFWWGDDDGGADGHAWYEGNSGGRTHPVGSKPANAFGLDGMAGNVWQWTQDCYAEDYGHAPTDGSAAEAAGDCGRVDRGGSWLYPAWLLRSATREWNPPGYRDVIMGFRLARALP